MALIKSFPLSQDETQELVFAARQAAEATARLWDVCRDLENQHSVVIEKLDVFIATLAGGMDIPPVASSCPAEDVIEQFFNECVITSDRQDLQQS
jgi:hypothetical protein